MRVVLQLTLGLSFLMGCGEDKNSSDTTPSKANGIISQDIANSVVAGTCIQLQITLVNGTTPIAAGKEMTFSLSSTDTYGQFRTGSDGCSATENATEITAAADDEQILVWYYAYGTGDFTLTIDEQPDQGWEPLTLDSSVTVEADSVHLVSAGTQFNVGSCGELNIGPIKAEGSVRNYPGGDIKVNLTHSGASVFFYSDDQCQNLITEFTLPADSDQQNSIYVSSTLAQSYITLTATPEDSSLSAGETEISFIP